MKIIFNTHGNFPASAEALEAAAIAGASEIWRRADLAHGVHEIAEPSDDPATARATGMAALANRRWQETQTFTYDGVQTAADGAATALTGAIVAMQLPGGPDTVLWKLADGDFREWDLAALVTFGQAVRAHVQACFDNEAALAADILAGGSPDIEIGWP